MLSVLIPTYNYDISELINELVCQLKQSNVEYELLISDDCSSSQFIQILKEFKGDENYKSITIFFQQENLGNAANRNFLINKAKFNWILFLDSDVLPVDSSFIRKYLELIKISNPKIISGNIIYNKSYRNSLRYIYGKKYEVQSLKERTKNPILSATAANFLINKKALPKSGFPIFREKYGYEDLFFFLNFSKNDFTIIDNPVYHLGVDSNEVFLEKTKRAIQNVSYMLQNNDAAVLKIKLARVYKKIKCFRFLLVIIYNWFGNYFEKRLLNKPSVGLFQIYKLLYLSTLDRVELR